MAVCRSDRQLSERPSGCTLSTELLTACQGTLTQLPQVHFAVLLRRCHSFVSLERSALISSDETRLAVRWLFEMMRDRDELYFKAEAKEPFD